MSRTEAIPEALRRGREEKLAQKALRISRASSIDEALAAYDAIGAAERASLDEAIERLYADAGVQRSSSTSTRKRRRTTRACSRPRSSEPTLLPSLRRCALERRRPTGWPGGVPRRRSGG